MKTKIRIFTLLITVMTVYTIQAQDANDFYSGKSWVSGENFTYHVIPYEIDGKVFWYTLSNVENRWDGQPATMKDGTPARRQPYIGGVTHLKRLSLYELAQDVFTKEEIDYLVAGKEYLSIQEVINDQGDVGEVRFTIQAGSRLLTISPEKFYAIEQYLKEHDKYILSGEAAEVTFIISSGGINFERFYILLEKE